MADTKRIIEVKKLDGWQSIEISEIKKGQTFRMFESDGKPVYNNDGNYESIADCDAYQAPYGSQGEIVWGVEVQLCNG